VLVCVWGGGGGNISSSLQQQQQQALLWYVLPAWHVSAMKALRAQGHYAFFLFRLSLTAATLHGGQSIPGAQACGGAAGACRSKWGRLCMRRRGRSWMCCGTVRGGCTSR
jgi:hypothetical protein